MTDLVLPYRYRSSLKRVVDGDTFDFVVDLGFNTTTTTRFRLFGVDTPEMRGSERPQGIIATEFVVGWFMKVFRDADDPQWPLVIDSHRDDQGKYGRWLADVFNASTGESLAETLLAEGLAERVEY